MSVERNPFLHGAVLYFDFTSHDSSVMLAAILHAFLLPGNNCKIPQNVFSFYQQE